MGAASEVWTVFQYPDASLKLCTGVKDRIRPRYKSAGKRRMKFEQQARSKAGRLFFFLTVAVLLLLISFLLAGNDTARAVLTALWIPLSFYLLLRQQKGEQVTVGSIEFFPRTIEIHAFESMRILRADVDHVQIQRERYGLEVIRFMDDEDQVLETFVLDMRSPVGREIRRTIEEEFAPIQISNYEPRRQLEYFVSCLLIFLGIFALLLPLSQSVEQNPGIAEVCRAIGSLWVVCGGITLAWLGISGRKKRSYA